MTKIQILRTAAQAIRDGFRFNWKKHTSCNCGIVAQIVMQKDSIGLLPSIDEAKAACSMLGMKEETTWSAMSRVLCSITGVPTVEVFAALQDAGFSRVDIGNLEYLNDPEILRRAGIERKPRKVEKRESVKTGWFSSKMRVTQPSSPGHYEIASNAAAYMLAWADMLEEAEKKDDAELEPQLKEAADRLMARE